MPLAKTEIFEATSQLEGRTGTMTGTELNLLRHTRLGIAAVVNLLLRMRAIYFLVRCQPFSCVCTVSYACQTPPVL